MLSLTRRSTLFGLTTVFSSLRASLAFGAADTDRRLVVVNLRGAMDGMAAVVPYGDPQLRPLRAPLMLPAPGQPEGLLDLGGFFGLHPELVRLHAMYAAGDLAIIHAVAGAYRERSHFLAQDLLESGAEQRLTSGWLNRAITAMPGRPAAAQKGRNPMAIGVGVPLLLRGTAQVENWAPSNLASPNADLYATIAALNAPDPLTGPAIQLGMTSRGFSKEALAGQAAETMRMEFPSLARSAGTLLATPNGPRIAALEIGGWDSHAAQNNRLRVPLQRLDAGLDALREALGPAWKSTAVLVMTEFGRTVRVNGTNGTDHGTATVAFVLGGAVRGGRVVADWPGLGNGNLFEDRDLMPTLDLRAVTKALVMDHLGVPAGALDTVFPGSGRVAPVAGLLRA